MRCTTRIIESLVFGPKEAFGVVVERTQADRAAARQSNDQRIGTLSRCSRPLALEFGQHVVEIICLKGRDFDLAKEIDKSDEQAGREFAAGESDPNSSNSCSGVIVR